MADISKVNVNSIDYDLKDQKSRDALVDVVDNGAKNLSQFNSGTAAADNVTLATGVPLVGLAGEVLVFSYETTLSSGIVTVGFKDANGNATGSVEIGNVSKQKIVTIPEGTAKFNVFVSKAGTYTNFMICTKAEWDISHTYVPYCKTNAELTNDTSTLFTENTSQQAEINYAVNTGAKNLLNLSGITPTVPSSLTLTDNNDGTFSVSGTLASANSITFPIAAISGNLILSGCPSGGGESSYMLRLTKNGTAVSASTDTGNGSQIFSMGDTGYALAARFAAGTYTNVIFKPMIRPAAISDTSYQPYARPNPALTAEMDYVVNAGAKNLLKIDKSQIKSSSWNTDWTWSGDTASNGNASITINQDNTFTVAVSNTMAAQVILDIYLSNDDVSNVILSGCPSGGSSSTHFMYVKGTSYYDTGNGVTFSKTGRFRIAIVVASGHAAGTYIFKPMLRPAAITDPTFQPYAKTNPELTVLTDEDRNSLVELVDSGAKNVLYYTKVGTSVESGSQYLSNGVRFSMQSDSSILVNRESSNANEAFCNLRIDSSSQFIDDFCNGQYVLSGSYGDCILRATNNNYIAIDSDGNGIVLQDRGAQTSIWVQIRVAPSASPNNVTVKPMICTTSAWKISKTYQPYRPSWQEMYERIVALENRNA